jgi:hypothetical protein
MYKHMSWVLLGFWLALSSAVDRVNAQESSPTSSIQPRAAMPTTKLKNTVIVAGSSFVDLGAGFQPIDGPQDLECKSKRCTYEVDQNVQVSGSTDSNSWAICTQIDGVFMTAPNCPFLGLVPNGPYGAGSFVQTQSGLAKGPHQLRTFLYTEFGAELANYTLIYRVYKE